MGTQQGERSSKKGETRKVGGREREVQKRVGDSLSLSEGKGGYETKIKRNKNEGKQR